MRTSYYKKGKNYTLRIHRLVAKAFLVNPNEKTDVNHKDGDKKNNNVENLEWLNQGEHIKHSVENDLVVYGRNHGMSKLSSKTARGIYIEYHKREATIKEIALRYKISPTTVRDIANKRTWRRATHDDFST